MTEHWGGYDPGDGPLRDDIGELTEKLAERDAEIERLRKLVRDIYDRHDLGAALDTRMREALGE